MLHIFPADRSSLEESVYATAAVLSASPKTDRPRLTSDYSLYRRRQYVGTRECNGEIRLFCPQTKQGQLVRSFLHSEWIVLAAVFARECSRDLFLALLPP